MDREALERGTKFGSEYGGEQKENKGGNVISFFFRARQNFYTLFCSNFLLSLFLQRVFSLLLLLVQHS